MDGALIRLSRPIVLPDSVERPRFTPPPPPVLDPSRSDQGRFGLGTSSWKVSKKILGYPYFKKPLAGRGAVHARRDFAAITSPRFSDYFPQRMKGMALDSGQLRSVSTRCLKIEVFCFFGALE